MEIKEGYGSIFISEPVTIKDVLNTLSFGNRALILFVVSLMRQAFTDLIQIGISLDADSEDMFKHIKYRCRNSRMVSSYSTFHEVNGENALDPRILINTLSLNLWDAYCSSMTVPAVAEQLKKMYELFRDSIEQKLIPEQAYDPSCGIIKRDLVTFTSYDKAKEEVLNRIVYGIRTEVAKDDGYILSWSNGGARWHVGSNLFFRGEKVTLDANEIFLIGDYDYLSEMAEKLPELPLYSYSLEGKMRAKVDIA